MRSVGAWFLGIGCYQFNELEAAAQYFTQIVENRFTAQVTTYRDAVAGLALIDQMQGASTEAWQMLESISQYDLEQRGSEDGRTRSLRARLLLLQGDQERAGRWVDALSDPLPNQPLMWLEEPQATRVRVLLARGEAADLVQANQILDVLDEIVDRTHNLRYQIELLALRAVALSAQGETGQTDRVLKQALELARPGGFIRVFVDLGEPMRALLRRLADQGDSLRMIEQILAAFSGSKRASEEGKPGDSHATTPLVESLTPREFEILKLLCGPLSIKEIALQLNISYETARRHTANIYAKLGVNGRRQAVARANELNI